MNAKNKRCLSLFFSIGLMGLMIMSFLNGNNCIVDGRENGNNNVLDGRGNLASTGGSAGFGGVYETNIIHRYENSSNIMATQGNDTILVGKPICDSTNANISIGSIEFHDLTIVAEDDEETRGENIMYQDILVGSFACIEPSILTNISVLLAQNIENPNNRIKLRVYNGSFDILFESNIIAITNKASYSALPNLFIAQGPYYIGVFGFLLSTNINWSCTSDGIDGDNDDESSSYKWNGTDWDPLPVDFHFNVTLSPLSSNPTHAEAGLTINGDPVDNSGIYAYEGARNASDSAIDFGIDCNWSNWSIFIARVECEFIISTSMAGDYGAESGEDIIWTISGTVSQFDESYTGGCVSHILEWVVPGNWDPMEYVNSGGTHYDFWTLENSTAKRVRVSGFNDEWSLKCSSGNIFSSIQAQKGAEPVSVVKSLNRIVINASSSMELAGTATVLIRNATNIVKYSEQVPVAGVNVLSSEIPIRDYLSFDYGEYTIQALFSNSTHAGFAELKILYLKSVFPSLSPCNSTQYMPLPFTINISFINTDYYVRVPQGWLVAYTGAAGSGQVFTDAFGTAQIEVNAAGLSAGNYSMIITLQENAFGPVLCEINYSFQIIPNYQILYEAGKCNLHVNKLEFNLVSLRHGYHLGKDYLWLQENGSWAEITIHFDAVKSGQFTAYDGIEINGIMKIGTADDPNAHSVSLHLLVKLEDILKWGQDHYLYENKPFAIKVLYYFAEHDYKSDDAFITWASGMHKMQWQYAINTQVVYIELNSEQFIYQIDNAVLYNYGWVRAHQELVMITAFPAILLLIFFAYRPYLRRHIEKQLEENQKHLHKLLQAGLDPTFEAYLVENAIEPLQQKLAKQRAKEPTPPPLPDLDDQLMTAHPSERRRFYLEGMDEISRIKKRGKITGLVLFAAGIMIVNGLALYLQDTKFLLPTSEPFLNGIMLLVIYAMVLLICMKVGVHACLPPKQSVRKFSSQILEIQKRLIKNKKPEVFSAAIIARANEIIEDRTPRFSESTLEKIQKAINLFYKIASSPVLMAVGFGLGIIGVIFGIQNAQALILIETTIRLIVFLTVFMLLKKSIFSELKKDSYSNLGIDILMMGIIQSFFFGLGIPALVLGILILIRELMNMKNELIRIGSHEEIDPDVMTMEVAQRGIMGLNTVIFEATILMFISSIPLFINQMLSRSAWQLHIGLFCFGLINLWYIRAKFIPTIRAKSIDHLSNTFLVASLIIALASILYGGAMICAAVILIMIFKMEIGNPDLILPKFDPYTGEPLEFDEAKELHQERTGEKAEEKDTRMKKFDPYTGKPLTADHSSKPYYKFLKPKFDPNTGDALTKEESDLLRKERIMHAMSKTKEKLGEYYGKLKQKLSHPSEPISDPNQLKLNDRANRKLNSLIPWILAIGLIIPMFFLGETHLILSGTTPLALGMFILIGLGGAAIGYGMFAGLVPKSKRDLLKKNKILSMKFLNAMVLEEIIFRYYLTGILLLKHFNPTIAIIIGAGAFAAFHLIQIMKYPSIRLVAVMVGYAFILGVYLGFLFAECGWIAALVAHMVIVVAVRGLLAINRSKN